MPNLDNIFNKFFPQHQTGDKGKFLYRMAWGVEILVAFIGLCIGIIIIKGSQIVDGQQIDTAQDLLKSGISLNDFTIGLIFIIVAVVELTKIPLATAVYYSVRLSWKIIFLIALILVNVSTFETIVTGFERINRERTKVIDKMIVEYNSIKTKIENLSENSRVTGLDEDINLLRLERSNVNKQISEITVNGQKRIQEIIDTGGNQGAIEQIKKEIDRINNNINNLIKANTDLSASKDSKVFGSNKKGIDKQISENNDTIKRYESERNSKETNLNSLLSDASKDNDAQIKLIKEEISIKIQPLNNELKVIAEKIKKLETRIDKENISEEEKDQKLRILEERKLELITEIDEQAPDNQVYRVATWLKGWFIIDYNKEIEKINEQIFELEKQKVKSITESGWIDKFFSFFNKNSKLGNEAIDAQILRLQGEVKEFDRKLKRDANKVEESVYADLPRGAIIAAFWLWFGVLSFIISITGTMLAFASLVLLDPRLHIMRNKRTAHWKGLSIRVSRFFVLLNKYIWGKIKRFRDPKIKIVEKEIVVEKEVEKIVEKNIGEKIVYEKVEVPKEVVRKEMVYVPLPTDDEKLLKKGPFKAQDYDKDKKK